MYDLQSLIERVEKASGPDRELDAAIDLHLFPDHRISGDHILDRMGFGKPIPHYTASLDAVMALMPEGYVVTTLTNGNLDKKYFDIRRHDCWTAMIAPDGLQIKTLGDIEALPKGKSVSAALALLSAILKSRLATNGGGADA